MRSDLRRALRALRRSPAFTSATILTLALAIGGNAAMFAILNTVLWKPLPIDPAGQLVSVYTRTPQGQRDYVTQPDLDDWRAMSRTFTGLGSWVVQSVNVTGFDRPERVIGMFVSADFLTLLGVNPVLGRGFAAREDRPGGARVALISTAFWRSRFAADPAILGKIADFNGEPYTVVGVLPPFVFPYADAAVFLPAFQYPNYSLSRAQTSCAVLARLRDGASPASAQAEMDAVAARLGAAYPETNRGRGITVVSVRDDVFGRRKPTVTALAAAVAFVLLIACANVAGLMIARLAARSRERAVRIALGAGRADLFGGILAEAALLAGTGGAVGLLLAAWAIPPIAAAIAVFLPEGAVIALDHSTALFTAAVSLAAAVFIAVIPALQPAGLDALHAARGAAAALRSRTRGILVAGQIALAMVLLAGCGLTVRSLDALARVQTGFDPRNLLMLAYRVPRAKYPTGAQQVEFHRRVAESIRAVPGVLAAASVRAVPFGDNGSYSDFLLPDRPEPPAAERPRALLNFADPDFFATLRIPVLRGRVFSERDQPAAPYAIVVNQTLARRYFPDRDPIGRHLLIPDVHQTAEIVGVVGDIKHFRLDEPPEPQIYGAMAQNPFVFTSIAVRTAGDPLQYAAAIRRAAWQVDKDQPVWSMHTFDEILRNQRNGIHWLLAVAFQAYATMAVILATIGVFGLVSYAVSRRIGEIGVRIALGARPADVLALILRQGATLVFAGISLGSAAAAWLSRYLASQLYGVSPLDPAVYATVAILLAAAGLVACLIPARRALRVDPVQALRQE